MKKIALLLSAVAALGLPSCSSTPITGGGVTAYKAYDRPAKKPVGVSSVMVKVSTSRQRVYVMEGSEPLLIMPVTVGSPSTPTPEGNFKIYKKKQNHRAHDHGYAYSGDKAKKTYYKNKPAGWSYRGKPLPYWCEFTSNLGFHTGWVKHYPSTDGCIRMHENVAPKFYALVQVGTPVNIAKSQPEDAKYGNIPLPPDAGPLPDHPATYYLGNQYFTDHKPPTFE